MLKLTNIKKDYITGDSAVHALKGVSLEFRESEFVSILGQSGCGKTTLLNIIGGLDKYSEGDLEINSKSTKKFTDRDWDTYRNHSVGFIFQSYNLIPHQTVLKNVELALTLAGVSSVERRERAKAALVKVGLGDQLNKKPNQMSGGQMQRVAIARALVNDPEILLADEPTGALDSETSVQIMELIKEISHDRLVIMVTHNPELAEQYSTRIINLLDGLVVSDTNPYDSSTEKTENTGESVAIEGVIAAKSTDTASKAKKEQKSDTPQVKKPTNKGKKKQTSMSFFTAFVLSLNNLLTKKGRTVLTSFAGSIGIIGIALIFAVSNGLNGYIAHVQETTLSSYPLTIESQSVDISSLMITLLTGGENGTEEEKENRDENSVYKDPLIAELVNEISKIEVNKNDLASFKEHLDKELADENSDLYKAVTEVQYKYNLNLSVYTKNEEGDIIKSDTNELLQEMIMAYFIESGLMSESESSSMFGGTSSTSMPSMMSMGSINMWQELLADSKNGKTVSNVITDQYDVIYGEWPNSHDEIVLVVDEDNELDDLTLYALGLMSKADIDKIIEYAAKAEPLPEDTVPSWTFKEICDKTYKVLLPSDFYVSYDGETVIDKTNDPTHLEAVYENALELRITGIIRLKDTVDSGYMSGAIGYTSKLTEYVIEKASSSTVAQIQKNNETYDVISRLPFESSQANLTTEEKTEIFKQYVNGLSTSEKAELYVQIAYAQAHNAPFDNPMTEEVETTTTLDTYVNMTLVGLKDKESAVNFLADAILMATPEADMEAIVAAAKASYEQANKGMSFDLLTEKDKQAEYKKQIVAQYKFNDYSYETLMKLITPMVTEGAKMQINAQVDQSLAIALPTNEAKAGALTLLLLDKNADFDFYYDNFMRFSDSTYEENLVKLGLIDMGVPSSINIYTSTFEQKDDLKDLIKQYNEDVGADSGKQIEYSDLIGDLMSSLTTIINAITYVLVAFVATSLIVSSIMIGVITLISVQERTKEIGVLRAMGASKRDISRVFNAETMIVGFISGVIGILVTLVLVVIINIILFALTGIAGLQASLGFLPAIILVVISMALTLVAGLIPSRVAAKKDPVIALRTE
ncbi:MAG: ABC transporter ATP-binding protein/permease [Clostridia bacterium]|nr:ABC transporter ATP-binding protein/permease [Clostridia bacterium]